MKETIEIERSEFYLKNDNCPYYSANDNFNLIFLSAIESSRLNKKDVEIWHYSYFEEEYRKITTLKFKK